MKRAVFAGSALVLVLGFVLGASFYKSWRAEKLDFMAQERASVFVRPHSPTLGSDDAKVYLVKFTDPACETCAAFAPYVHQALKAFPGRIRVVLRYAPFHEGSRDVARALEAARLQGKFWESLEVLYANQSRWTERHRVQLAKVWPFLEGVGVDVERARADMQDPRITAVIKQDLADAATLGVRKTPGFFVNGKALEPFGARPLVELIKSEVAAQYPD